MAFTHIEALEKLAEEVGMPVNYCKRQWYLGPPENWDGDAPPNEAELYIGKIPHDVMIKDLYHLFANFGEIYMFQPMTDRKRGNLSYCLVQYANIEAANKAMKCMKEYKIDGKLINVSPRIQNTRLYMRPFAASATVGSVFQSLTENLDGVTEVQLLTEMNLYPEQCAIVTFRDRKSAEVARKEVLQNIDSYKRSPMFVSWAFPGAKSSPKTLRIRDYNPVTADTKLRTLVDHFGNGGLTEFAVKKKYVEAKFDTFYNARAALNGIQNFDLDGHRLNASWRRRKAMHQKSTYHPPGPTVGKNAENFSQQRLVIPVGFQQLGSSIFPPLPPPPPTHLPYPPMIIHSPSFVAANREVLDKVKAINIGPIQYQLAVEMMGFKYFMPHLPSIVMPMNPAPTVIPAMR